MGPVTIKIPLALRESKHDFSELSNDDIRILYLDSEGKPRNSAVIIIAATDFLVN